MMAANGSVSHRPQHRDLVRNMLQFGRLLRSYEMLVTPSEIFDGLRALEQVDLNDRGECQLALRTTLTSRLEDLPTFDRLFDVFWRSLSADQDAGGPEDAMASPNQEGGEGEQQKVQVKLENKEEGEESDEGD